MEHPRAETPEDRPATEPLGLSAAQAAARLRRDGYNELPSAKPKSAFAIALEVLREPMFLLLIAAATIYLVLGDHREAMALAASVLVVIGITFAQERKTERALEALRELSSPRALVIRNGEAVRVAGRDLVCGDVVILEEGDRVPADAVLLSCADLSVDESLLTGESVPVRKRPRAAEDPPPHPGGDDLPYVFSGTLLTQGSGVAEIIATGPRTEIGGIGKALQSLTEEPTRIQREMRRVVLIFASIGLALCVAVVVLYGLTRGDWLAGLLAGVTLAMSNLPEEIPVVLTVFLALGARRIARRHVLTRRAGAIEALGAATVLCVDKTGTLTLNQMALRQLYNGCDVHTIDPAATTLPEAYAPLLLHGILASEADPFDPMEKAFHACGRTCLPDMLDACAGWQVVREYPLSPELLAHSHLWRTDDPQRFRLATKGAPEAIAGLCRLDAAARAELTRQVDAMAAAGLRVLGVALANVEAPAAGADWPDDPRAYACEFLGLVGLADPLRPSVPAALKECYAAGVRTVMITGDYPGTARAIAEQAGLRHVEGIVTGAELAQLGDAELAQRVQDTTIFARVVPAQKLRIVDAFKRTNAVVAMTGDGVNDAPALKAAHIGIAMGKRGTDVAREAAALVLLEDDFASIVHAIRLGRRIFDNIQKALHYILAVHVPTAGIILLSLLFGWPLVLFPLHIVFLEFVIDPACSIVFEAEPAERDVMRRPPRSADRHLLTASSIAASLGQGLAVLAAATLVYAGALHYGVVEGEARSMAFAAIVLGNIGLILTNRSRHHSLWRALTTPNRAFWWIGGAALGGLLLTLYLPALAELFRQAPLGPLQLAVTLAAVCAGLALHEVLRGCYRRFVRPA